MAQKDDGSTERFFAVGQGRPELVLALAERAGGRATGRFLPLGALENRVYMVELEGEARGDEDEDEAPGRWVVLKIYRPGRWSQAALEAEHTFLGELAARELPVVAPLPLVGGGTLGQHEGLSFAVFPRVGGRSHEELTDEQLGVVGRLMARVHAVGALRDEPARPRLTPAEFVADELAWARHTRGLPREVRSHWLPAAQALTKRVEPLFEGVPTLRLHGDCHLGNLLWAPDGVRLLDFDDLRVGPAVQDLWMLAPAPDAEGRRRLDLVVRAYRQFRDFDPRWLRLVEPLRGLRMLRYAVWAARRQGDPVFQETFPQLGTPGWWQREGDTLRRQLALVGDLGAGG